MPAHLPAALSGVSRSVDLAVWWPLLQAALDHQSDADPAYVQLLYVPQWGCLAAAQTHQPQSVNFAAAGAAAGVVDLGPCRHPQLLSLPLLAAMGAAAMLVSWKLVLPVVPCSICQVNPALRSSS